MHSSVNFSVQSHAQNRANISTNLGQHLNAFIIGRMNGTPKIRASKAAAAIVNTPNTPLAADTGATAGADGQASAKRDAENLRLWSLVQAMARQEQQALSQFYDATMRRVFTIAQRIVQRHELAEEVVSDTYMQAWREADRYDASRGRVLAWLLIIARSRALDCLRRQDEAISHPDPHLLQNGAIDEDGEVQLCEGASGFASPPDLLATTERNTALHQALLTLSPIERQLLALAFFRGLSHAEIAEHSGLALGTVKTHIRRALSSLRAALGDDAAEYI
jgi:RNA polymerase sigma factor (sigma-70 family)